MQYFHLKLNHIIIAWISQSEKICQLPSQKGGISPTVLLVPWMTLCCLRVEACLTVEAKTTW